MKKSDKKVVGPGETTRSVVLHYHFFKNAGTSLDSAFKSAIGKDKWATKEFVSDVYENRLEVHDWIDQNKNIVCFSSHTALLPPPVLGNTRVLPVIFVRHPIDRIASVYSFERTQEIDSFGANLAKECTFAGYIEKRLSRKNDYQCRNFHAHRLCLMDENSEKTLEMRAKYALDSLKIVGLVEAYDESLKVFNAEFKKYDISQLELKATHKNATRSTGLTLDQKIDDIREDLGTKLFDELVRVNRVDLFIYKILADRYSLNFDNIDLCA